MRVFFYLNSLRRVLFYGDDKVTGSFKPSGLFPPALQK
ncbi:hypothetical protein EC32303_0762 [Escherichia coli 3.2303]|nr:hypothetical protein EC32303_0762 [Escherichia coli 3.2303]EKI22859.1 hypothetical protein ECTW15901_0761 [Escherichia coli TW15901]EKI30388.1 hypothetical protein ECTW00353_0791 [Escherichia coli TW00353]